jgi:hypothetical protein
MRQNLFIYLFSQNGENLGRKFTSYIVIMRAFKHLEELILVN